MLSKQLNNIVVLARMGLQGLTQDKNITEETLAEVAADLVAVKKFAATYTGPVDPIIPPRGNA